MQNGIQAVFCFISGRRRVAVSRYRMIFLVLKRIGVLGPPRENKKKELRGNECLLVDK